VWTSADGRTWEDVTPPGVFENASLSAIIRRSDASLLVVGNLTHERDGAQVSGFAAWESDDGRRWTPTQTGLPGERWIREAAQGERGVLANVWQVGATHGTEVWYSSDGRTWEIVREFGDGFINFDAGEEGFVIAGTEGPYGEPGTPFAIASADGREWFEAPNPPDGAVSVAAIASDWVILTVTRDDAFRPTSKATWHSANGLDWSGPEELEIGTNITANDSGCPLEPSLLGEGRWLVLRSYWSGLCSEGGSTSFGPRLLSEDGGAWRLVSAENGSGSSFNASAELDGALVLAGESNRQAALWLVED
jgi:hypothetical protein